MRKSRRLSDRLETRQQTLDALDRRLERFRTALDGHLQERIATLEQKLARADSERRRQLVETLNKLREQQRRYRTTLPEAPAHREISQALKLAERAKGGPPGHRRAAADELLDTREQIRRRLEAVQKRLEELKRRKQLTRRTRAFRGEEAFFDEAARASDVQASSNASQGRQGTDSPDGDGTDSAPRRGAGAAPKRDDDPSPGRGRQGFKRPPPSYESPAAPDEGAAGGGRPESGPSSRSAGGRSSPFAGEEDAVLLERQSGDSPGLPDSDEAIDEKIEKLENEREELRKQVEQLEDKADSLQSGD
ncbi:MAG: hypothetical protein ABEL76_13585 [Bradymonadaceae bacterium]